MQQYLILIPIVTDFIKKQHEAKKQLMEVFRTEIMAFALKLMIGLIITSLIIFMVLSIGKEVNSYILLQENGSFILISVYSLIILLGGVALTMIYKSKKKFSKPNMEVDLTKIFLTFFEGVSEGLKAKQEESNATQEIHTKDPVSDTYHARSFQH